jgi:ribose 5-phosphate isomerase B
MPNRIIAIASDHAGYGLKGFIKGEIKSLGYEFLDLGTDSEESVDYPDFAKKLADVLGQNQALYGILICGSGIGISIAANRYEHIRAALCVEPVSAFYARAHNDANVLVFGSKFIGTELAKSCLKVFLETPFEGGRHAKRLQKLLKTMDVK